MCDQNDDKRLVTGHFCECDDGECLDEDTGEVCGGRLHSQLLNYKRHCIEKQMSFNDNFMKIRHPEIGSTRTFVTSLSVL